MRTIVITICCFLLQAGLAAQQEITVISGQVYYYPQAVSKPILKIAGTQFELKGKLRCKGSESVKLVYNGHYFVVSGSKMRNVQDVVNASVRASEMSFTGRFYNFLYESVKEGDNPENIKKYHRKYMDRSRGGVKGFANPDYIATLLLATGKLPSAKVLFNWRNTPGEGPYTFTLLSAQSKLIAQILVQDTAITLDLDQLALNLDEEYDWKVSRGVTAKSDLVPFEVCPANVVERQTDLSHLPDFQIASPQEQQLMLAYKLEEEECFYAANQTYLQLLAAAPDNPLILKMYATFLARRDMLPEANTLLSTAPK